MTDSAWSELLLLYVIVALHHEEIGNNNWAAMHNIGKLSQ